MTKILDISPPQMNFTLSNAHFFTKTRLVNDEATSMLKVF